jgi:hypothetical protein
MVDKKRGLIFVVLVLVFLIGSFSSLAIEPLPINGDDFSYGAIGARYDEPGSEDFCDSRKVKVNKFAEKGIKPDWGNNNWWNVCNGYTDCKIPHEEGCWFLATEVDSDQNDNGYTVLPVGKQFNGLDHLFVGLGEQSGGDFYATDGVEKVMGAKDHSDSYKTGDANDAWMCLIMTYKYSSDNAVLCSDDHYWHECKIASEEDEGSIGTMAWANNVLYNCTTEFDIIPFWKEVPVMDYDQDGYTTNEDCDDNPADDPSFCSAITVEDVNMCDGGDPKYLQCAICINEGAIEVCGDGINNDCDRGSQFKEADDELDETKDNCNLNPWACEQRLPLETSSNENLMNIKDVPKNIYNEEFSWLPTSDGGQCCGFNGLEDLGDIYQADNNMEDKFPGADYSASGNYVCLHRENDPDIGMVGYEGDFPDSYCKRDTGDGALWQSKFWCWVNAVGDAKYEIFTIKEPGKTNYDIVSNGGEWKECKIEADQGPLGENINDDYPLSIDTSDSTDDIVEHVNRFYCYEEGDHFSWTECFDELSERKAEGIKGRYPGESLYTLPLSENLDSGLIEEKYGKHVDFKVINYYDDYYGDKFNLDFSNYEFFNFMVQFCEIGEGENGEECIALSQQEMEDKDQLPANIELIIYGPNKGKLFNQTVLGYVINNRFFENDKWMHVRVPLNANIKGVKEIEIISHSAKALIKVKNVYLSNPGDVPLCSGFDSKAKGESSWIEDIDSAEPLSSVNGKKICSNLYGEEAWLGEDSEITSITGSASCCGDDGLEDTYFGKSKAVGGINYGCWNALPIADKSTTMNVEFNVSYTENDQSFIYPQKPSTITLTHDYFKCPTGPPPVFKLDNQVTYLVSVLQDKVAKLNIPDYISLSKVLETSDDYLLAQILLSCFELDFCVGQPAYENKDCFMIEEEGTLEYLPPEVTNSNFGPFSNPPKLPSLPTLGTELKPSEGSKTTCENIQELLEDKGQEESCDIPQQFEKSWSVNLKYGETKIVGPPVTINKDEFWQASLKSSNDAVNVYFYEPLTLFKSSEMNKEQFPYEETTVSIVAEINEEKYNVISNPDIVPRKDNFTYPCDKVECIYPLPGIPSEGISITNPNPEVYELYFVSLDKDGNTMEELITPENAYFEKQGNVKAKKVAQQVIFISPGEENEFIEDAGFFGCNAASYLIGENKLEEANNKDYCSIKGGSFCSPSVTHELLDNEKYTTISSWSNESITEVGYDLNLENEAENVEDYFSNLILDLKDADPVIGPKERNYSAKVLPAKNFISNAEFERKGVELTHWEILVDDTVIKDIEKYNIIFENKSVELKANEIIKSERIAVPHNSKLYFSHNGSLTKDYHIIEVDKDGKKTINPFTNKKVEIETGNADYIQIQFEGPGIIKQPMLQLDDGLGPAGYNYIPEKQFSRSGVACCPENHCWNGYACAESMVGTEFSQLAEHIEEGRDYRCIDGDWKHLPIKWDWGFDKWGFCSQEDQCFVLKDGKPEYGANDFYEGDYPICVNNEEYIFDHYCEAGNWTSRTKQVATKLLEVAENDDFVMYCTNYRDSLLEYDQEDYLGGKFYSEEVEVGDLSENLDGNNQPEAIHTCYDQILDPEGKRLISDKENTCVNNVCVLRFKEGGGFKSAFATTLNNNITDPNSFLISLGVNQPKLDQVCQGTGDVVECDLSEIEGVEGSLWYIPKTNSVIYGKEGISVNPTPFKKITNWFSGLFSDQNQLSEQKAFIDDAENFRELYMLNKGDKTVKAIQEIFTDKKTLIAEYENFETPICDYVEVYKNPSPIIELDVELLELLSNVSKFECAFAIVNNQTSTNKIKVEVVSTDKAPLDFFWPQLTGKIRTN